MSDINHSGTKWGRIGRLAASQHGVVSRAQLRRLGLGDGAIEKAAAAGRLHPAFRGTFGVGHPLIGERARTMAAVLACGPDTVVSHLTAAHLLGLRDGRPPKVELISAGDRGRGIDGIRRHLVPAPRGAEAGRVGVIPCTSPARTIVDLGGILGERPLRHVVERAAVRGILELGAAKRIMATTRRRGAPMLRQILSDWQRNEAMGRKEAELDLRSELEARFLALINGAGLPAPHCNQAVEADGETFVVDFLWSEQHLVVETDGGRFHDHSIAFERDRRRDRALHVGGYRVVRLTHRQIEGEPDDVVTAVRRLLGEKVG